MCESKPFVEHSIHAHIQTSRILIAAACVKACLDVVLSDAYLIFILEYSLT